MGHTIELGVYRHVPQLGDARGMELCSMIYVVVDDDDDGLVRVASGDRLAVGPLGCGEGFYVRRLVSSLWHVDMVS